MRLTFLLLFGCALAATGADSLKLISTQRIWNTAPHSAFGDITRFHNEWFVVFREGMNHVASPGKPADGKLRVIHSKDGNHWTSTALIEEPGIDLRDPHLSITADNRLMVVAGGSEYPNGTYHGRQPRVMFSRDGTSWSAPQKVLDRGHWLWRVTWHKGEAWGVSKYGSPGKELPEDPRRVNLVRSKDGVHWTTALELKVPGGDESTIRFLSDDTMVILMRRRLQTGDAAAVIGVSKPPYRDWKWSETTHFIGGPNFIVLPGDRMIEGGRWLEHGTPASAKTAVGEMSLTDYQPELVLPSGGDSSYPGFAFYDNVLWTLYYSSHEDKTAIYLAKIQVR